MDDVRSFLDRLGLEPDAVRALGLLPLVEVAWADGGVQLAERWAIDRFAKEKGWYANGADGVVQQWMVTRPEDIVFAQGHLVLATLVADRRGLGASFHPNALADVLEACQNVAQASGSLFGLVDPISPNEAGILARIATDFGLPLPTEMPVPPFTRSLPPGPKGRALVGSIPDFAKGPVSFLAGVWREYGDIAHFDMGPRPTTLLVHPDAVQHVLTDNSQNYVKAESFDVMKDFVGEGLLTSDGDFWRRQRRIAAPMFHGQAIATMAEDMTAVTQRILEEWRILGRNGAPIDIAEHLSALALRITGQTLFGSYLWEQSPTIARAARDCVEFVNQRFMSQVRLPIALPTKANRRFHEAKAELDGLVFALINERRAVSSSRADFLQLLLDARDPETHQGMSDTQVHDELLTLLSTSANTTACALAWTIWLLSLRPMRLRALREEVESVLGGRVPTVSDLPSMPVTRRTLEEAIRLRPPFWMTMRRALADDSVRGYRIAAGTQVLITPYLTHRHPQFWVNPEAFDPDRFLPEEVAARHPFAWIPFGGGPRKCVGDVFAMMEMQLVLPMIVSAFDLHLVPGSEVAPNPGLVLAPKGGLWMMLRSTPTRPPPATSLPPDAGPG